MRTAMDALRNAKRFYAAVSFIADTGLKDATGLGGSLFFFFGKNEADAYWQYNRLVKAFPLNNLFSSTTSTKFTNHQHATKMKTTTVLLPNPSSSPTR